MSDRDALLAAIRATPAEDAPRLVYADWLDENGSGDLDAATVEFIRVSCDMRSGRTAMPAKAYPWLGANWRRLVPTVLPDSGAAVLCPDSVVRFGRSVRAEVRTPRAYLPDDPPWSFPVLFDFRRGFLFRVTITAPYAVGALFGAFCADQPGAVLCCPGLCDGATFAEIKAHPWLYRRTMDAYRAHLTPAGPSGGTAA